MHLIPVVVPHLGRPLELEAVNHVPLHPPNCLIHLRGGYGLPDLLYGHLDLLVGHRPGGVARLLQGGKNGGVKKVEARGARGLDLELGKVLEDALSAAPCTVKSARSCFVWLIGSSAPLRSVFVTSRSQTPFSKARIKNFWKKNARFKTIR